jgi:hypothetical protein
MSAITGLRISVFITMFMAGSVLLFIVVLL